MKKAVAILLTGILLTGVCMTGCSGSGETEPENTEQTDQSGGENEPVTIRFSWWGSQARNDQTQEVVDLFEEEYPWITVECEFVDWDQYFNNLSTQIAAGDMPDILQHDYRYLETYVNNDLLMPLDQFVGNEIDLSVI